MDYSFLELVYKSIEEPDKSKRRQRVEYYWNLLSKTTLSKYDAFYFIDNYNNIEMKIINLILDELTKEKNKLGDIGYSSRFTQNLNVELHYNNDNNTNIILYDELFDVFLLEILIVIFYWAENTENVKIENDCYNHLVNVLNIFCINRNMGNVDFKVNFTKFNSDGMINLTMDCYWAIWTFIMAHEIGHIFFGHGKAHINTEIKEYQADNFSYNLLLKFIENQSKKVKKDGYSNGREDIEVYEEYTYLAPIILLDIFDLTDYYRCINGQEKQYKWLKERKEKLFNLIDNYDIQIDTYYGEELYINFINIINKFKEKMEKQRNE